MKMFRPLMLVAAMALTGLFSAPMLANEFVGFGNFALEESYIGSLFDVQNEAVVSQPIFEAPMLSMAIQSIPPELAPRSPYNSIASQLNGSFFAHEAHQVPIQSVAPG